MPCTTLSNHRAGQPWVKPGHDDEERNAPPKTHPLVKRAIIVPPYLSSRRLLSCDPICWKIPRSSAEVGELK